MESAASSDTLDGTEPRSMVRRGSDRCGHGIFNHNLVKIAALMDAK